MAVEHQLQRATLLKIRRHLLRLKKRHRKLLLRRLLLHPQRLGQLRPARQTSWPPFEAEVVVRQRVLHRLQLRPLPQLRRRVVLLRAEQQIFWHQFVVVVPVLLLRLPPRRQQSPKLRLPWILRKQPGCQRRK